MSLSPMYGLFAFLLLSISLVQCAPDPEITGDDGAVMIRIPGGKFTRGGAEREVADHSKPKGINFLAERPLHDVKVSSFYIDKHEVTNERYWTFLDDLEASSDTTFTHPDQPADYSHGQSDLGVAKIGPELRGKRQPVVGVSWFDAYAYCSWAGKRLPTAAEWEYAARGRNYRTYPWGDQRPDESVWRANYSPKVGKAEDGFEFTAPVGSYPDGYSPFGVADMVGNAAEWVNDWMDPTYYHSMGDEVLDPRGPAEGRNRTLKGGSYYSGVHYIRIGTRSYGPPGVKSRMQGFRCARDI